MCWAIIVLVLAVEVFIHRTQIEALITKWKTKA